MTWAARHRYWREHGADLLLLLILASIAVAFATLQGDHFVVTGARGRWVAAMVASAVYAFACLALARRRRRAARSTDSDPSTDPAALPVVYASQTGLAEVLAQRTVASLRAAGLASVAVPIAALDAERLAQARRVLFVVSTTGEGDAPDMAAGFERATRATSTPLDTLHYGLLALGDRDYAQFCGFGRRLDQWLRTQGATPWFDPIEVDNGDEGALRHWLHHLRQISGAHDLPDWETPRYQAWQLQRRRCLNPGSLGAPVFHLELVPAAGVQASWQAGDIAEVGPRHASADVAAWLDAHAIDGTRVVEHDGERDSVANWLARAQWPDEITPGAQDTQWITRLQRLPHREYSIASLPEDGALHLLVRQHHRSDGTPGLGSGWLTLHAPLGASVDLRLRRNPGFHPPSDPRPLLLIGNGTGLAGLRAVLKARARAGHHRNWLIFGERQAGIDDHYAEDLAQWQADAVLERLDRVYSRDGDAIRYVQHRLAASAADVRRWIDQNAWIMVCGSLDGMAGGVDQVLRDLLGSERVDAMIDSGRYRRDVY